jgi:hypothetical protein
MRRIGNGKSASLLYSPKVSMNSKPDSLLPGFRGHYARSSMLVVYRYLSMRN